MTTVGKTHAVKYTKEDNCLKQSGASKIKTTKKFRITQPGAAQGENLIV